MSAAKDLMPVASGDEVLRLRSGPRKSLDLVVGRKPAGLAAGIFERAVDGDVELAGLAGAQLDVRADLFEAFPHTEGLRLITSSAAIFDQDFHAIKVGA